MLINYRELWVAVIFWNHICNMGAPPNSMLTLCLVALGLSMTVFAFSFRHAKDGYQDEGGFHDGSKTDTEI